MTCDASNDYESLQHTLFRAWSKKFLFRCNVPDLAFLRGVETLSTLAEIPASKREKEPDGRKRTPVRFQRATAQDKRAAGW